jgi:trans-aconitate methyltransferase
MNGTKHTKETKDTKVIDSWDPRQYDKFEREREQPFYDLLSMVRPEVGMHVVDLGCGTGKLTRALHQRLQARETVGIDRSASMLASTGEVPRTAGLRFEEATIEAFAARAHVLAGRAEVVEWVKGTLLTDYARHLPADVFERFLDDYRTRLFAQLDAAEPFFFPFKRILCWGQKSS